MKSLHILLLAFLIMRSAAYGQSSLHISNKQFKAQFLSGINQIRAKGCNCGSTYLKPTTPLVWNDNLADAAREHAHDMYRNNYFNHQSKDGRTMQDRFFKVGYNYNGFQSYAIGENIAAGQQSIEEVLGGWFKSEGHCKNLMNPAFKEIGIAEDHYFWVQDFGGRTPFSSR